MCDDAFEEWHTSSLHWGEMITTIDRDKLSFVWNRQRAGFQTNFQGMDLHLGIAPNITTVFKVVPSSHALAKTTSDTKLGKTSSEVQSAKP